MSSNQAIPNLYAVGAESGVKKIGETVSNRALNFVIDSVKKGINKRKIEIGTAFDLYLSNAYKRYNHVKTLATGSEPRAVIGKDNIYVKVGLDHDGEEIDISTVRNLLRVSNNIIISGTGGIGKSMLMRYLFLQTVNEGEYIPVLVELRKISEQKQDKLSIEQLIKDCIKSFGAALPDEEFEYSLELGKYLFLFDGFDEVKALYSTDTAKKIQEFCGRYPENACIITTRPTECDLTLETFTPMSSKPLTKEQAVELTSKLWKPDEKTEAFSAQLRDSLYQKHKSFAKNPLLLSMMFLTFMRYGDIPDYLAEFYEKAYSALYNLHDNRDKGYFKRDFCCKDIDEAQFKLLFACFCFNTYFKENYEFSEKQILRILDNCIQKRNLTSISAKDFLADLQNAVCLIVKDGFTLRFAHRSFQTYFAAVYTSEVLTDEQQARLLTDKLNSYNYWNLTNYFKLLFQIEPERFFQNALEKGLREIISCADNSDDPNEYVLKEMYSGCALYRDDEIKEPIVVYYVRNPDQYESFYFHNSLRLFWDICFNRKRDNETEKDESETRKQFEIIRNKINNKNNEIMYASVDRINKITDDERKAFYDSQIKAAKISELTKQLRKTLDALDKKRAALENDDFIDSL